MSNNTATCLCQSVKMNVASNNRSIGACHCGMCRKVAGGPLLAVDCGQDVQISGQEHIGVYSSSDWAERGFCKVCGSSLFYRLKEEQQYFIPAGLFDDQNFKLDHQIFIDHKPSYYDFANETHTMTEQEVFEKAMSEKK
ncbi:GFA family protein [bacterium]|nr:GFA family protein [bacterium]